MKDLWCKPILSRNGNRVSGGAARNVRISQAGGMDKIITDAAADAARLALERSEFAVRKANLQLVKKKA